MLCNCRSWGTTIENDPATDGHPGLRPKDTQATDSPGLPPGSPSVDDVPTTHEGSRAAATLTTLPVPACTRHRSPRLGAIVRSAAWAWPSSDPPFKDDTWGGLRLGVGDPQRPGAR